MRLTRTIFGFAAAACFTLTPAYADHGHASAPKPTTVAGKPTTSGSTKKSGTTTPMNPVAAKIASKPNLNNKVTAMLPKGMSLNDASAGFKNQGQFIAALHVSQNLGIPFADLRKDMITTTGTGAAATSTQTKSLGQAIQDLKHTSSSTASTQTTRAEHDADDDVKSTTTTTTTSTKQKVKKPQTESEHESDDRDDDHHVAHHESKESHKEPEHRSVAQQISSNQQLKTRVQGLLPAGVPLSEAAQGFRSESQFLAALHASKDLGIPFTQIKAEMTGHDHDSLTRAIEELKPSANAEMVAKTAQQEAAADIKATRPTHTDHDGDDQ